MSKTSIGLTELAEKGAGVGLGGLLHFAAQRLMGLDVQYLRSRG